MSDCPESLNDQESKTLHTSYIDHGTDTNAAGFYISLLLGVEKCMLVTEHFYILLINNANALQCYKFLKPHSN